MKFTLQIDRTTAILAGQDDFGDVVAEIPINTFEVEDRRVIAGWDFADEKTCIVPRVKVDIGALQRDYDAKQNRHSELSAQTIQKVLRELRTLPERTERAMQDYAIKVQRLIIQELIPAIKERTRIISTGEIEGIFALLDKSPLSDLGLLDLRFKSLPSWLERLTADLDETLKPHVTHELLKELREEFRYAPAVRFNSPAMVSTFLHNNPSFEDFTLFDEEGRTAWCPALGLLVSTIDSKALTNALRDSTRISSKPLGLEWVVGDVRVTVLTEDETLQLRQAIQDLIKALRTAMPVLTEQYRTATADLVRSVTSKIEKTDELKEINRQNIRAVIRSVDFDNRNNYLVSYDAGEMSESRVDEILCRGLMPASVHPVVHLSEIDPAGSAKLQSSGLPPPSHAEQLAVRLQAESENCVAQVVQVMLGNQSSTWCVRLQRRFSGRNLIQYYKVTDVIEPDQ